MSRKIISKSGPPQRRLFTKDDGRQQKSKIIGQQVNPKLGSMGSAPAQTYRPAPNAAQT